MNILIPHTWLLEHLETDAKPEEIQKYLSLCGPSIERIYDREDEPVYDIEVTTNRVDSFSVRGIAREAAAILPQFGIPAHLKPLTIKESIFNQYSLEQLPLPKIINNPDLNKRTIYIILKNVKRNQTPAWMAKRLRQIDMNVHDAVIDITNYVTHELGHPCHAFDYDKLMKTGGEIIITEASKGEKFSTLDGEEFETIGGEVVFKSRQDEIIDLPSIKGTLNTSIDESTQNVLLLLESITANKVRFASMSHAIRTTAAQLMEKGVDPYLAASVLKKGAELYTDLCAAQIGSLIFDDFSGKTEPSVIEIKKETIDQYLGINVSIDKIINILQTLECEVVNKDTSLLVKPPSFRTDLIIPADIVEEIARIYGYHNLPSVVMDTAIPLTKPKNLTFELEVKIKHLLADLGWQEVYTYSMVSEELALNSGLALNDHLKIQNPLTDDKVFLRRSLIPSLVQIHQENPLAKELSVFEMANLYHPQPNDIPATGMNLTLVSNKPYRQVRGDWEAVLDRLFVNDHLIQPSEVVPTPFIQAAKVMVGQLEIGLIGVLANGLTTINVDLSQLAPVVKSNPSYQPISKTSTLIEDLTFTLSSSVQIGEVLKTIKEVNQLIVDVQLTDIYKQNYSFCITYHNPNVNLTNQDVEPIRKEIIAEVTNRFQAQLVGSV